jgi:hypothetical protein
MPLQKNNVKIGALFSRRPLKFLQQHLYSADNAAMPADRRHAASHAHRQLRVMTLQ